VPNFYVRMILSVLRPLFILLRHAIQLPVSTSAYTVQQTPIIHVLGPSETCLFRRVLMLVSSVGKEANPKSIKTYHPPTSTPRAQRFPLQTQISAMLSRYVRSPLDALIVVLGPMLIFKTTLSPLLLFTVTIFLAVLGHEFELRAGRPFGARFGRILCLASVPLTACYFALRSVQIVSTMVLSLCAGSLLSIKALVLSVIGILLIRYPDFIPKLRLQVFPSPHL
jgi:hypothetical protein